VEHLKIWIQILTLIVGGGVLLDTWQRRQRLQLSWLRPLWWGFLFLNLCYLAGVFSEYLLVNFFADLAAYKSSMFGEAVGPFTGLFFVGLIYSLFVLGQVVTGRTTKRYQQWIFYGLGGFVLFRFVVSLSTNLHVTLHKLTGGMFLCLQIGLFLLGCLILARFTFGDIRSAGLNKATARAFRWLGGFYLAGCLLILLSALFAGPAHGLITATCGLAFNLFPFVWYRRSLVGATGQDDPGTGGSGAGSLDQFHAEFDISRRQKEIVELVLAGKSNKDIGEALFIAPSTVKNHLYALYQKVGVKSRYELIGLVMRNQLPPNPESTRSSSSRNLSSRPEKSGR